MRAGSPRKSMRIAASALIKQQNQQPAGLQMFDKSGGPRATLRKDRATKRLHGADVMRVEIAVRHRAIEAADGIALRHKTGAGGLIIAEMPRHQGSPRGPRPAPWPKPPRPALAGSAATDEPEIQLSSNSRSAFVLHYQGLADAILRRCVKGISGQISARFCLGALPITCDASDRPAQNCAQQRHSPRIRQRQA